MRPLFDNEIDQVSGGTNFIDLNPGSVITVTGSSYNFSSSFGSFNFSGIAFGSQQSSISIDIIGSPIAFLNTDTTDDPLIVVTGHRDISPQMTTGQIVGLIGLGIAATVATAGIGEVLLGAVAADAALVTLWRSSTLVVGAAVDAAIGALGAGDSGGNPGGHNPRNDGNPLP